MRKLIIFLHLVIFQSVLLCASYNDYRAEMIRNLDVIEHTLSIGYAPASWKKTYLGWDLDLCKQSAVTSIQNQDPTTKTFHKTLRKFFTSMRDYHAGVFFFSTEISLIPLHMKQADGHFFVVHINKDFAHMLQLSHVAIGDELIAIDNEPINDWFNSFLAENFPADPTPTDIGLATMKMFERSGAEALTTPSGFHTLTLRTKNGHTKLVKAKWFHLPEMIHGVARSLPQSNPMASWANHISPLMAGTETLESLYRKKFLTPMLRQYLQENTLRGGNNEESFPSDEEESFEFNYIGHKTTHLPPLGKILWHAPSTNSFDASIQQLANGKKIGFLRIPTYSISVNDSNPDTKISEISDFQTLVKKFQNETDLLVIDQMDNGGGLVFYMYTLASMLTDKKLQIPQHTLLLTSQEIEMARSALDSLIQIEQFLLQQGYKDHDLLPMTVRQFFLEVPLSKADLAKMIQYYRDLIALWHNGQPTTPPLPLAGIESISPHPEANYTKPIVILTNELDISCGDFFPAIMQDNGRAKIFGGGTAGAGGAVTIESHPNRMGISFYSYTKTLGWRSNGQTLENLGVTPDMPYSLTPVDLKESYREYKEKLIEYINSL